MVRTVILKTSHFCNNEFRGVFDHACTDLNTGILHWLKQRIHTLCTLANERHIAELKCSHSRCAALRWYDQLWTWHSCACTTTLNKESVCLKERWEERGNEMESVHRYKCISAGKRCHRQDLYNSFYWSMQYWKLNSWSDSSTKVPAWVPTSQHLKTCVVLKPRKKNVNFGGPCPTSIWRRSRRLTSFTTALWNSLWDTAWRRRYAETLLDQFQWWKTTM